MKRSIFLLSLLSFVFFGTIATEFSLANSENTAELLEQVVEINHTKKSEKIYQNSVSLFDDTVADTNAPATDLSAGSQKPGTTFNEGSTNP